MKYIRNGEVYSFLLIRGKKTTCDSAVIPHFWSLLSVAECGKKYLVLTQFHNLLHAILYMYIYMQLYFLSGLKKYITKGRYLEVHSQRIRNSRLSWYFAHEEYTPWVGLSISRSTDWFRKLREMEGEKNTLHSGSQRGYNHSWWLRLTPAEYSPSL